MDKEKLMEDWIAALRSGNYLQGEGMLHNPDDNSYCCLGVLVELAEGTPKDSPEFFYDLDGPDRDILSPKGLPDHIPFKGMNETGGLCYNPYAIDPLIELNDDAGLDFYQIADVIEFNKSSYLGEKQ